MRNQTRPLLLVLAGLAPACTTSDVPHAEPHASASTTLPAGYLSTRGNQVVDQSGAPVRLACVGYFAQGDAAADVAGIAAAGFNCLRYAWYNQTLADDLAGMDATVAAARAVGLKVILDHHGNEVPGPNNGYLPYPCNGLPFDLGEGTNGTDDCGDAGTVTEARYVQDWVTVMQHFAGDDTVIGVDLTNEPHLAPTFWADGGGGATWGDGTATDIRAIYSEVGEAIQAVNPGVLLICEGPFAQTGTLYNGETSIINGAADLTLAASQPVTVGIPNKVVYSVHEYPSSIGGASADSGSLAVQSMTQAWGFLVAQNIAPVWIGEMGASLDGAGPDSAGDKLADEQAWAATLVPYLNGEDGDQGGPTFGGDQLPIGTDWWAWGHNAGQEPDGTIGDDGQLRPEQYAVYSQLQSSALTLPPPRCTTSADRSVVTTIGVPLCDAAGNTWALTSAGTITLDGGAAPYSANVVELAYVDGVLWQENTSQRWWAYASGTWAPNDGTSTAPL